MLDSLATACLAQSFIFKKIEMFLPDTQWYIGLNGSLN